MMPLLPYTWTVAFDSHEPLSPLPVSSETPLEELYSSHTQTRVYEKKASALPRDLHSAFCSMAQISDKPHL